MTNQKICKLMNSLKKFTNNGTESFKTLDADGIILGSSSVEIFSIQELIQNHQLYINLDIGSEFVPVLHIRDVGDMFINIKRLNNEEPYLTYPGSEMYTYFTISFEDWLEYIIMCNGNSFWTLT